jgi:regulator of sigma E protease
MGILVSLIVLLLIVAIHEYGHYFVMRRNGVRVEEFSVGLGPPIFQRKNKHGTVISLRLIPLGGYVKPASDGADKPLELQGWEKTTGRWARFRIYMAGMFANSIAAFIALAILFHATHRVPTFLWDLTGWAPHALRPLLCAWLGSFGIWLATPALIVILAVKMGSVFWSGTAGPLGILMIGNQAVAGSPDTATLVYGIVWYFAMINGAIAGFNLLPLFPLDGGRVAALVIEKIAGSPDSGAEKRFKAVTGIVILTFALFVILSDFVKLM